MIIGYNTYMKTFFIVIIVVLFVWIVWSFFTDSSLESPTYIVLEKKAGYEIREYDSHIIAETTVSGNASNSTGKAFREIGGYIFGENTENQSIAMTTPVTTAQASTVIEMTAPVTTETKDNMMTMSFMMPSRFNLDNLPNPNSNNVSFREVPSGTFATIAFSGRASTQKRLKKTQQLTELLKRDGVSIVSEAQLLQYDRPTKFPLLQKNEIKIEIQNYE
ncbi:MAG: DNA gyrase inhibitor GyrI [Flavobacteriaceae bacterium]|jgi:DNA gyrase inhibitor GyrI